MKVQNSPLNNEKALEFKKRQLRKACREFESLFTAYLLKSMRSSIIRGEEISNTSKLYEGMFDEAVAREISLSGAFGLGDILYEQLLPLLEKEKPERGGEK